MRFRDIFGIHSTPTSPEGKPSLPLGPEATIQATTAGYASEGPPEPVIAEYLAKTPIELRGLNLGCGGQTIKGWINIDAEYPWHQDILWDLSGGLPFVPDWSFSAAYSEHFMEHIPRKSGLALMKECFRAIRSGGHVRIAMPDLDMLVQSYHDGGRLLVDDGEFTEHYGGLFFTRGELFDIAMRAWGHIYLYNYEDLEILLRRAGFVDIHRVELNVSDVPLLADRETRPAAQSGLIAEARRP